MSPWFILFAVIVFSVKLTLLFVLLGPPSPNIVRLNSGGGDTLPQHAKTWTERGLRSNQEQPCRVVISV